jgi:predicted metal-binding membrane protein
VAIEPSARTRLVGADPAAGVRALALVVAVAALAWAVSVARMRGMMVESGVGPAGLAFFVGFWATMTAAMMLPSAAPTVVLVARIAGGARQAVAFVGGYVLLWVGFGLVAYAALRALPGLSRRELIAGAAIVAAGAYQLTPLKRGCLRRCRTPLGFVAHRWREGPLGPVRLGVEHGVLCVGCCAGLMAVVFALGLMSLVGMAVVTLAIAAEKLLPGGERLSVAVAVGLVALGVLVALDSGAVPA